MAESERHYSHATIIRDALITYYGSNAEADGIKADEIRISDDFMESYAPSRGIHVTEVKEGRGIGLVGFRAIRYQALVSRVMPKTDSTTAMQNRSKFRQVIYSLFDNKRIMSADAPICELITKVSAQDFKLPRPWREAGLDITSMMVMTHVRES